MKVFVYDTNIKEMLEDATAPEGYEIFLIKLEDHQIACENLQRLIVEEKLKLKAAYDFVLDLKNRFSLMENLKNSNLTLQTVALGDIDEFIKPSGTCKVTHGV